MRSILIILFFLLLFVSVKSYAQKWMPGRFTDIKGNTETGLIRIPAGNGPVKDEAFIEYKEDAKANAFQLSAGDLKCFIIGKDSFVVAHAPQNQVWAKKELDFVKVALNEDIKLYVSRGGSGNGGHSFGLSPGIGVGTGVGTGGYGGGVGAGLSVPIFGGDGGGDGYEKTNWYFGANTAEMKPLTNENFEDVMSDIMGDEPDVVDKIHRKVYVLANVDRLVAYFKQVKSQHH